MLIRSILLDRVRGFVHFEKSFEDPWSGKIPDALLLLGPNGSGKSTVLDTVATLWQGLAQTLRLKESGSSGRVSRDLSVGVAAVEIVGLDQNPVWLYAYARPDSSQTLVRQHLEAHRVGLYAPSGLGSRPQLYYAAPGKGEAERVPSDGEYGGWIGRLAQRMTENMLGKSRDLPNMVYLESEARSLPPIREGFTVQPEPEEFRWLARYEPTTSRRGSAQNYLYNLKVVDEGAYEEIVRQVNAFLAGKHLTGFDPATGQLMVAPIQGQPHPVEDLSSGEKQVLLMLATITRWLRPGGIVLIDEPDLHLHVALGHGLCQSRQTDGGTETRSIDHRHPRSGNLEPIHRVAPGQIGPRRCWGISAMTETPLWVREIEDRSRGLPVLLVEGKDDVPLIEHFLTLHAPDWRQSMVVACAGNKRHVFGAVSQYHPADWLGIVDRDEWSEADIQKCLTDVPRVRCLPRFCIESFFCDPVEIWAALPERQRGRVGNDPQMLAEPILARLPDWVAHGAMWRVLRALYGRARLPHELENKPVTDEQAIRAILTEWHEGLAPDAVLQQYREELANAGALSPSEQLHVYIHGKKFFRQVVVQVLDHLFSGQGRDYWLGRFRDAPILPPKDLSALLDEILAPARP